MSHSNWVGSKGRILSKRKPGIEFESGRSKGGRRFGKMSEAEDCASAALCAVAGVESVSRELEKESV